MNQPKDIENKNSVSAGKDLATVSSEELAAQGDGQPCPTCQCDGTIEGRRGRELQQRITALEEALKGVIRVADRKTVEFDAARAALAAVVHNEEK